MVRLQGIDPNATYVLESDETGETRRMTGQDLVETGFAFALPARSGAIWFYRRAGKA